MKDQERVPLRVVLRNFLNHIENLESQSCPEKSYEAEFQDLKIFSENVKSLKEYSCLEGEKEANRKKNRYKDILPFDVSRVILNEYAGIPGSDYINANFIKGASGSPAYIASQGPLPSTVNDFWRMVVQCEVQVIVMACNEEEAGKAKCEKYWVDDGEEKQFGMISVKLLKSSTVCPDFSVRTMRLKYNNNQSVMEERTVCQLHYVAWPDHGVPTVVQPLLDMVRLVRDTQASETLPVLVHCSAGCGRTGTICAIDYVWGLLRTGKLTSDFSLLSLIREMRKQRIAMVQTKEQYVLVHQAVRELFKEQLCMIDSHPYENVDPNGLLIMKEEENTYDCIEYNSNNYLEEKNDNKEKEVIPPPLPSKKNISKFPSKYEKEVENLSAQQRSINYMSSVRSFLPLGHMNEKKKVNNEYDNNFEKINKKVPDNITKSDSNKPIPSKGILRVPHLEKVAPKSTVSIKRSKSLKVVSNCDKSTLSFCQNSPTESKRRSSLESNFDEYNLDSDVKGSYTTRTDIEPSPVDHKKKNVSQLVSKYDIIKNQDHKTFIRSLTSLDMRQKIHYNNSSTVLSSFDDNLAKQKCKLLRSNTQINVLKRNNTTYTQMKSSPHSGSSVESVSNLKSDSHSNNFHHNKPNHNATNALETLLDQNLKIRPKPIGSSTPTTKHLNLLKSSSGKDLHLKNIEQLKTPPYQKLESARQFKEITRPRGNSGKPDQTKTSHYEDLYNCYSSDKSVKLGTKQDRFAIYGIKSLQTTAKKETSEALPMAFDSSRVRANQLKLLRSQKKPLLNKTTPVHQQKQNAFSMHNSPKGTYNSCCPYQEDLTRNRMFNAAHEEFPPSSSYVNEDYPTFSDHKSGSLFSDHYISDESHDMEPSLWMERDAGRLHTNFAKPPYNTGYVMTRPRGPTSSSKPDEPKEIPRRLEIEVDGCRNISVPAMVDHYEEMNSDHDLTPYDASYGKECVPVQPNEIKYIMQNRRNVHQYNSSVHTTRHKNIPATNMGPELSNPHISRPIKTPAIQQRSIEAPSFSQDSAYFSPVPEIARNYRGRDCFHSAPGVDLDQVAASITKDDENLMKVTLEELQVRKTKLQMAPKERIPHKGLATSLTSGDKKKQQQYL